MKTLLCRWQAHALIAFFLFMQHKNRFGIVGEIIRSKEINKHHSQEWNTLMIGLHYPQQLLGHSLFLGHCPASQLFEAVSHYKVGIETAMMCV